MHKYRFANGFPLLGFYMQSLFFATILGESIGTPGRNQKEKKEGPAEAEPPFGFK
jgi:hypothetical protein